MAGPPAPRARLLPVLLSLTAHALVLAALWLWRGADRPPNPQVLDTRVEVSLADPPPLDKPSGVGSSEGSEIIFKGTTDSPFPQPPASDSSEHGPTLVSHKGEGPLISRPGGSGGPGKQGTGLLAPAGRARRVVYVLDRSLSMGPTDALAAARREVLTSLRQLPVEACFQVIAFNETAEPLRLGSRSGLLPAEPAVVEQAAQVLDALSAAGESRHVLALRQALALGPDLVFFVTDADELHPDDVQLITHLNQGRAVIHTVELTARRPRPGGLLGQLASANRGTYRCAAPRP
jgi:hypothetical protein